MIIRLYIGVQVTYPIKALRKIHPVACQSISLHLPLHRNRIHNYLAGTETIWILNLKIINQAPAMKRR